MAALREFRRRDVPEVTGLWLRSLRRCAVPASPRLQRYFEDMLFDGPWFDDRLPSLVCEEPGGGIVGFLGVLARPMIFDGEAIRMAVATQLVVDERARPTFAAMKLARAYFGGAQDLSFCDGANEFSERLWYAGGGEAVPFSSLDWVRVLRPAQHLMSLAKARVRGLPLAPLLPAARVLDAALARGALRRYRLPEPAGSVLDEEPGTETLLWCVRHFTASRALRPHYDPESFRWLLGQARAKVIHGDLRAGVVRDEGGAIAGWYLYYLRPGAVAQVLQFGGQPKSVGRVLNHLFCQAFAQGALAVCGKAEHRYARALAGAGCGFAWRMPVLVQSKRREILDAIHRGDTFLTRLEGEWWARFSDPVWVDTAVSEPRCQLRAVPRPAAANPAELYAGTTPRAARARYGLSR